VIKRLFAGVVAGKLTDLQGERLIDFWSKLISLTLVSDFGAGAVAFGGRIRNPLQDVRAARVRPSFDK